jgi:predicted AAA+ superfamily ATPase
MQIIRMWIEREWAPAVTALAQAFPAVLVTGPRQVGKTALLRHDYPRHDYVSFDDPARARQAETQPASFFDSLTEPAILDEVQYVPSLFRPLKQRIDRDRRPGRFLLTGSQTFALMEKVAESLAGRVGILEMSSLAYREARAASPDLADLDFLVRGGYPELYAGAALNAGDFYPSYLATYLERDVRNVRSVGDLRDFDRFLRAAALRSGQLLSYSDLARDVGVAPNTAKAWISVLQTSGQILLLEPYHRSLGKRLTKSPKLYFLDTGVACHLIGIDSPAALLRSPLAGALWETFVVGQVVRHFQVARTRPPLWFWRTAQGEEVDLLVERGGRFIAIECKLTETPDRRDARAFGALAAFYGPPAIERALIACRTPHAHIVEGDPRPRAVGPLDLVSALE